MARASARALSQLMMCRTGWRELGGSGALQVRVTERAGRDAAVLPCAWSKSELAAFVANVPGGRHAGMRTECTHVPLPPQLVHARRRDSCVTASGGK